MNFVVKLLKLLKYDAVMTIVNSVFKRAYFIPTNTTIATESMVRLFLYNVWKLYSLSNCMVLDKGLQFVLLFTKKLYQLLRVEIVFSTIWYLQLDRQIKQVNQKLD